MKKHTETDLGDQRCPYCRKEANVASSVEKGTRPKRGDFSVCLYCAEISVIDNNLTLRRWTAEEQAAMPNEDRQHLAKIQASTKAARQDVLLIWDQDRSTALALDLIRRRAHLPPVLILTDKKPG